MNRDFSEMLSTLIAHRAEFLIVGAHALAVHGRPRATGDLDIWVRPSRENAARVWKALAVFGAPLDNLTVEDLATPGVVYQIGLPPDRVDILTAISGVEFADAWLRRIEVAIERQLLPFLSKEDLILNKRAAGRLKDLADIDGL